MAIAIAKVRAPSFIQTVLKEENRGLVYGAFAALCIAAGFVRSVSIGNGLAVFVFLGIAPCYGLVWLTWMCDASLKAQTRVWRFAQLVSVSALGLLLWVMPGVGIWVIPERAETSLTRSVFWTPVFVAPTRYTVEWYHAQSAGINVISTDGVPLFCSVFTNGILLNGDDAARLEKFLLGIALTTHPEKYLNGEVETALATSAGAEFRSRSSEEIQRYGQFLIPYKIGSPMGDMLARNLLRWRDGTVTFRCELQKFQSN